MSKYPTPHTDFSEFPEFLELDPEQHSLLDLGVFLVVTLIIFPIIWFCNFSHLLF